MDEQNVGGQFRHQDRTFAGQEQHVYSYHGPEGEAVVSLRHHPSSVDQRYTWDKGNDDYWEHSRHQKEGDQIPGQTYWLQGSRSSYYNEPTITEMASTGRSVAHAVPTLLGIATRDSLRRYGKIPRPDDDLSANSAPIVRKAVERGITDAPRANPDIRVKNDYDRETPNQPGSWAHNMLTTARDYPGDSIPAHEVSASSQMVRSMLRKPQSRSQNFEQGRLF